MDNGMSIPDIIHVYRLDKGMNLSQLAQEARISVSYLSRIEHGSIKKPSFSVLRRIEDILDVQFPGDSIKDTGHPPEIALTFEEQQLSDRLVSEISQAMQLECARYTSMLVRHYPLAKCCFLSKHLQARLLEVIRSEARKSESFGAEPIEPITSNDVIDTIFEQARFGTPLPQGSSSTSVVGKGPHL